MAELQELLRRADVLSGWHRSETFIAQGETRVEFGASVEIRGNAHARPPGAIFAAADLELDLAVGPVAGCAGVTECEAQVLIEGISAQGKDLRFALHLDRHDGNDAVDLHSLYHWQVGGNRLDGLDISGALVLEGPRFPWHPLDPLLLVDFVLGHFHGEKRTELMTSPDLIRYRRLLKGSQAAFVTPFFQAIAQALHQEPAAMTPYWPSICRE